MRIVSVKDIVLVRRIIINNHLLISRQPCYFAGAAIDKVNRLTESLV